MRIDGFLVNELSPAQRGIAMVFQSYALYPHMTVYKNMAFGLKFARTDPDEVKRRVLRAAEMLQLTPLLDRLPRQPLGRPTAAGGHWSLRSHDNPGSFCLTNRSPTSMRH